MRAIIKAEIERLQKVRSECDDTGIREKIDDWIEAEKRKLTFSDSHPAPSVSILADRKNAS
jgi:hypothetical protein